ncbi:MAG TPA: SRPBCC family protein [Nocardioidaceae bacterium]|nr:SRPBCC family protein [Nocardioidaceae bacterium]
MADQTTSSIVISAPPAAVMGVIADFDAYPEWAQGVKQAEVVETGTEAKPEQVCFHLDAGPIRDTYTLAYDWRGDEFVSWTLVESNLLKQMDGAYELTDMGDGTTEVAYRLVVDIAIPMIGMLKRKAEKVVIDTALKGLKKRVESQTGQGSAVPQHPAP